MFVRRFLRQGTNQGIESRKSQKVIDGFSFAVLFILMLGTGWNVYDKQLMYAENERIVSRAAVENVRDAVVNSLETKKRILDSFVEANRGDIIKLIESPHQQAFFNFLYNRLKKMMPDLYTINLYEEGKGVLTNYQAENDFVGRICKVDLEDYLAVEFHEKRTHPTQEQYHYDEISSLKYNGIRYLFFSSFSLDSIVSVISHSTPEGHQLMVVNDSDEGFVEITNTGVRSLKESMSEPSINNLNSVKIISKAEVPGTHWVVIDIDNHSKRRANLIANIIPMLLIYSFIAIIILFMRSLLKHSFYVLTDLNNQLAESNREITDLNVHLESMTLTDPLTGLYNRRYFDMQYEREWNRARRVQDDFCVFMIDVDYFKKFNDTYGHQKGDYCLKKISEVLSACFSRGNEFVARYGGEEFIAVSSGENCDINAVSDSIHQKLNALDIVHEKSPFGRVTVSIGVARYKQDADTSGLLVIGTADEALYLAKESGRNRTHVITM